MAAKKKNHSAGLAFLVAALKKNRNAVYADLAAAARRKRLTVYPIMYGRAKLLLGHTKAGQGKARRKAGRPSGRGPGRPRQAALPTDPLRDLVDSIRSSQQEVEQYRRVFAKIAELLAGLR